MFRSVLVAAIVVLVILWPVHTPGAASETRPFSRSEWIARNADRVPFSSGVLPTGVPLPRSPRMTSRADRATTPGGVSIPVRVSSNLIPAVGTSQAETQAEPYLAVNREDPLNLVAGWQESRFTDGGARANGVATSYDGGVTWVEQLCPNLTPPSGGIWDRATDPWVAFGPGNRAYFCSLVFEADRPENAIGVNASTDGGRTWGPVVLAAFSDDDFNDKQSITVDTSPGSPHLGALYVAWDANVDNDGDGSIDKQVVLVTRSSDGGLTWGTPTEVRKKGANIGCIPRVGPNGDLYLVWTGGPLNFRKHYIYFAKSVDGGETWSKARRITRSRPAGVDGFRTGEFLPSFDVDPATGALYVAWADARFTGVDQATLISSTDGGNTWSAPRRVSDGPDDAAAFTIAVAARPGGHVAISYYSLRNDPAREFLIDVFAQVSEDGGATFGAARLASSRTFDIRAAAQSRGYFLGDYIGLAGSTERFHLLWVDTTEPSAIDPDRRQPDVFAASTP